MLLTFIAILTGLSWQAGGVSARAEAATSQVSAVAALATVQQAKVRAVAARPLDRGVVGISASAIPADFDVAFRGAPAVRIGIDRARE